MSNNNNNNFNDEREKRIRIQETMEAEIHQLEDRISELEAHVDLAYKHGHLDGFKEGMRMAGDIMKAVREQT